MTAKLGFLFPGQGSQTVGMGSDFLEEFPVARDIMNRADNLLDFDLQQLIIKGPAAALNRTAHTQPALFTVSMLIREVLKQSDITPVITAGHSLGEYAALATAGAFSFEEGLRLVKKRGQLMEEAVPAGRGSMAAIIGLDSSTIDDICKKVEGICEVANYNSPIQIVISGEKNALDRAIELAREQGAKKAVKLNVSGPFHSSLMHPARDRLAHTLSGIDIQTPVIPVVANVTGDYVTEPDTIRQALLDQLTGSVRWQQSMKKCIDRGITTYLEVGPGRILKGLMRRIDRSVTVHSVRNLKDLDRISEQL
ncbi:MAG: ACP S-malonyltransferase [Bacillota bacterium]